jgi:EAL domain-containing protein (putative c-di-GMP-specific phosphodiesterase class I)/GGDEF domain-containing protein
MKTPHANPYKPKILIYSKGHFLTETAAMVHARLDCLPVSVHETKELLPAVYDHMPVMIIAEVQSPQDPALDILMGIKNDAVLEYVPIILVAKEKFKHPLFQSANVVLTSDYTPKQLAFSAATIMLEVEHQLDIDPFSSLPGHHTSMRKLQSAIDSGDEITVCTIRVRRLEIFSAMHGGQSADILLDQIMGELGKCFKTVAAKNWLLGHLGKLTFVAVLPDIAKASEFANALVDHFEKSYDALKTYATQDKYSAAKDNLRNNYFGAAKVSLSVAVMPLKKSGYVSVQDLIHASTKVHNQLNLSPDNVIAFPIDEFKIQPDSHAGEITAELPKTALAEAGSAQADFAPNDQGMWALADHFASGAGKIETYFQPIVDYWEKSVHAYEALSRFIREDGSFVHPEALFNAARESDRVLELDVRCLEAALANFTNMKTKAKLFLNVDRATFAQLGERIDLFDRYPALIGRLVVELTEQSLVGERKKLSEVKSMLEAKGIAIAFDDAGTGDVSFREVGEIRPAYIKFDRKLISGITRSPLKQRHVLSMRAFAKGVGAMTIAEGIEMPSEFEHLKMIRLSLAQGYYIARPEKNPIT